MKPYFFIGLFIFVFTSCKTQSLTNTTWVLTGIEDPKGGSVPVNHKHATLEFTSDSAYSGKVCNDYHGKYSITGKKITMTAPVSTYMYCVELQDLENKLLKSFPKALDFEITGNKLLILTSDHQKLRFISAK